MHRSEGRRRSGGPSHRHQSLLHWGGFKLPAVSWRHGVSDKRKKKINHPREQRYLKVNGLQIAEEPLFIRRFSVARCGSNPAGHGGSETHGMGSGRYYQIRRAGMKNIISHHKCNPPLWRERLLSERFCDLIIWWKVSCHDLWFCDHPWIIARLLPAHS